jgi:ubiquinone/menaquinone biosynthesis C-methylase UbiE
MDDRQRSPARRSRMCAIQFEVADAQAPPFSDASFEVFYSFASAKHWPDPLKGIGECWRVLKPAGELLVADATSDATSQEMETYRQIEVDLQMPEGTVSHLPTILFRTRKPSA